MGFRNHKDPLYYDSKANNRVFIPDVNVDVSTILIIYVYEYRN